MLDIEHRLRALSAVVDWPATDLSHTLRIRVQGPQSSRARRIPGWMGVTAAILVVLLALVVATPWGRKAVADILGVAGISIGWGEPATPAGAELDLGELVSIREAVDAIGVRILIPHNSPIGEPDAIYLATIPSDGSVHLVWRSTDGLPAAGDTGIATLYSQFKAHDNELFVKSVDPSSEVLELTVRGRPGFWIEGDHYIVFRDSSGSMHDETARLSGNALAWEEGGLTHRIETTLSLDDALALAESLQPS